MIIQYLWLVLAQLTILILNIPHVQQVKVFIEVYIHTLQLVSGRYTINAGEITCIILTLTISQLQWSNKNREPDGNTLSRYSIC